MESMLDAEFFGTPLVITAPGLTELLRFHLGPHVCGPAGGAGPDPIPLAVGPVTAVGGAAGGAADRKPLRVSLPLQVQVRDASGAPLLSRVWRSWGNLPPPIPPFALWPDRFAVAPAIVLAKGEVTVALTAAPDIRHVTTAMALAHRGWCFVSGSLLVLDRGSGTVLPCHLPLQAHGPIAGAVRASGLPAGSWRAYPSALATDVLLVRPEAFGPLVPIAEPLAAPTLIRVCPSHTDEVRLVPGAFHPPAWPAEARTALTDLPVLSLDMPDGGAPEAARLIDRRLAPRVERRPPGHPTVEDTCPDGSTTRQAPPAGSIGSRRT
jgi:hypothetical protein